MEAVEAVCKFDEPPDALLSASVILRERAHAEAAVALRQVHARQQVKGGLEAKGHVRQRSCASECTSLLSQLEGCLAKMGNCLTLRCSETLPGLTEGITLVSHSLKQAWVHSNHRVYLQVKHLLKVHT